MALGSTATAQWSNNPAQNSAIGDQAGDQAVPKIAATPGGGCYIGWFDNSGSGYQVRLQRLDVGGHEQWPHNGIVVSSNPQNSSLVGWDLMADSQGNCVLTFTDVRSGPDLDVYAYRIDPTGAQLWGQNGVTLSSNADSENNPKVCETSLGMFAFAWSNNTGFSVRVQMLTAGGTPLFAPDGIGIAADTGANPGFVGLVPSDNGSVILSWVRTIAFSGNKHVHMQKVDVSGAQVWNGGTRIAVFDSNSVPIAHEPRLVADGIGGAVCAWHFAVGSPFFARAQHVDSAGTELFPHNGVDVSTNGNSKFDPAVTVDVPSQHVTVVWNERNTAQSTWGISAQQFDLTGARLWGSSGVTLMPVDTTNKLAPVSVPYHGGALAFVLVATGAVTKNLHAMAVDSTGAQPWNVDISTAASDKLRVWPAISPSGLAMLCWGDARTPGNGNDIFAQSIGANGVIAPDPGDSTPYGCGGNPGGSLVVTGRPALAGTFTAAIDNPLGTQAPGSLAVLAYAFTPAPGFPCGVLVPGFGMSGPGANGEILLGAVELLIGPFWNGPGQPALMPLAVPDTLGLYGVPVYLQGAIVDFAPGAPVPIGVTTGVRVALGF